MTGVVAGLTREKRRKGERSLAGKGARRPGIRPGLYEKERKEEIFGPARAEWDKEMYGP